MSSAAPQSPRLEAFGLSKSFPVRRRRETEMALEDFSLSLSAGQIAVLAGANGAGKSTALKIMAGLELADEGRVRIFGASPRSLEARRRSAWLPDATELFPFLNWKETLRYFGEISGTPATEIALRIEELGATWGLDRYGKKRVGGFSLGMRRRLAIASVLIARPDLLLLDEPISGLDPEGQMLFVQEILREKERGATIVMSSHHFSQLEEFVDHLCVLRAGKTLVAGSLDELGRELPGRDITARGLDAEALVQLAQRARELGGELGPARLARADLDRLVLGERARELGGDSQDVESS
jgi:ABC-type multidrug transport system ATPase subunit